MSWFPDAGSDQELVNGLAMYGQVLAVAHEKIRGAFGQYFSGNRIVTILPNGNIDDVPDFKDICVHGNLYTYWFTVMGLKVTLLGTATHVQDTAVPAMGHQIILGISR